MFGKIRSPLGGMRARQTFFMMRAYPDFPEPLSPYTTVNPFLSKVRYWPSFNALTLPTPWIALRLTAIAADFGIGDMFRFKGNSDIALAFAQGRQIVRVCVVQFALGAKAAQRIALPRRTIPRPCKDVFQGFGFAVGMRFGVCFFGWISHPNEVTSKGV